MARDRLTSGWGAQDIWTSPTASVFLSLLMGNGEYPYNDHYTYDAVS
jgi:hypothetical protein